MTRRECLEAAAKAVLTDRNTAYGEPEDSFSAIAGMWSVYLGRPVSSCDVACMMALLKIVRAKQNPHHDDSWTDLAGYAACGAECADRMCGCEKIEYLAYLNGEVKASPAPALDIRPENIAFLAELDRRMQIAEAKHPHFAEGVYQGIGVVTEEVGELSQAANKGQGEERLTSEGWDTAVVAARFARGDWRKHDE